MSVFRRLSKYWRQARVPALFLVAAAPALGAPPDFEDLAELEAAARQFLGEQARERYGAAASVAVNAPDRRLRLKACAGEPDYFLAPSSALIGRTAVGIRCSGPQPWKIFLTASVSVSQPVVVSARSIGRGETLAAGDIALRELDVGALAGVPVLDLDEAVGMELRRPVAPGVPLTAAMLRKPVLVERGETVTLLSSSGRVEVRVNARALSDGVLGGRIDVENLSSRRRVDATVAGPGLVRAGPSPATTGGAVPQGR